MSRLNLALVLLAGTALFFAGLLTSPSFARLTQQDPMTNNSFGTRSLVAPTNLSATASGHDITMTWNTGLNGNGYAVLGVANGASNNCNGVTYSPIAMTTLTNYTDANRSSPQGVWYCYQTKTIYSTWSSIANNPTTTLQIGFVAASVRMNNGGAAGQLDTNDQIVVTFNQAVDTSTGPANGNTVCTETTNGTILLGAATISGTCYLTETVTLGKLAGGTLGNNVRFAATYAWSNGNKTLTVTIGGRTDGLNNPNVSSATWTLTPTSDATKLKSATGAFHICDSNAGSGNCLPTTTTLP